MRRGISNYKTRTGAQRYNARMSRIWEQAWSIKQRDCKHKFVSEASLWTDKKIKVCKYCGKHK